MLFEPNVGREIPIATAESWCENFQKGNRKFDINWTFFGSECIKQVLDTPGVTGLKTACAEDDDGNQHDVLIGVDEKGGGIIAMQFGQQCPPDCQ